MMNAMDDEVKISSKFIINDVFLTVKDKSMKKVFTEGKTEDSNE